LQDLKPKVSESWDVQSLGQLLSLEYGAGLTESGRKPGNYPVFGSNGIIGYHNKALINGPGIVVGRRVL
jgi:type I restriction enzyme S subunit